MNHRISVGGLVVNDGTLLLVRHYVAGKYDFWVPRGGGVEGDEELAEAFALEAFEETGIRVKPNRLAYIDELIDDSGRMIKFWYCCEYISGRINIHANPATEESITEAGLFAREKLPSGHLFPTLLLDEFWNDLGSGFVSPKKLPLQKSIF